jgi:hypothetical protein
LGGFVGITQNIGRGDTDYSIALSFQSLRPFGIALETVAHVMRRAIDFHY